MRRTASTLTTVLLAMGMSVACKPAASETKANPFAKANPNPVMSEASRKMVQTFYEDSGQTNPAGFGIDLSGLQPTLAGPESSRPSSTVLETPASIANSFDKPSYPSSYKNYLAGKAAAQPSTPLTTAQINNNNRAISIMGASQYPSATASNQSSGTPFYQQWFNSAATAGSNIVNNSSVQNGFNKFVTGAGNYNQVMNNGGAVVTSGPNAGTYYSDPYATSGGKSIWSGTVAPSTSSTAQTRSWSNTNRPAGIASSLVYCSSMGGYVEARYANGC